MTELRILEASVAGIFIHNVTALLEGLERALDDLRHGKIVDPEICHRRVSSLYSWHNVTQRTEKVYASVTNESAKTIGQQLRR